MPQYYVAIHLPDDFDPSTQDEATIRDIYALNDEIDAAGVGIFACGLAPASSAKSLRPQPNGEVLVTDGPYLEAKEHVGGFSIIEAADMDEVLAWARKGAIACRAPGEVREMFFKTRPKHPSGSDNAAGDAGPTGKAR
ncbi:MAG: YciI family protein [Terracidiphilus sp.]